VVEDLAVHVHVVPDEVGVDGDEQGCDDAGGGREPAPADPPHDERGAAGDGDLRDPDDFPVPAEEPVQRQEEPAVERLRVRGGMPRDEAVRSLREVGPGEDVALLDVRDEDDAALVQQRREPRERSREH
jgi:hypothetical protein